MFSRLPEVRQASEAKVSNAKHQRQANDAKNGVVADAVGEHVARLHGLVLATVVDHHAANLATDPLVVQAVEQGATVTTTVGLVEHGHLKLMRLSL